MTRVRVIDRVLTLLKFVQGFISDRELYLRERARNLKPLNSLKGLK